MCSSSFYFFNKFAGNNKKGKLWRHFSYTLGLELVLSSSKSMLWNSFDFNSNFFSLHLTQFSLSEKDYWSDDILNDKKRNFLFFLFHFIAEWRKRFSFFCFFLLACDVREIWHGSNFFLWKETNFTDIYCVIESKRIFLNAQFLVMTKIEFRSGIWVRRGQAFALFLPLSESMRFLKTLNVSNPCKNSIDEKKRRSAKALKTFYSNFLTNFLTNFLLFYFQVISTTFSLKIDVSKMNEWGVEAKPTKRHWIKYQLTAPLVGVIHIYSK